MCYVSIMTNREGQFLNRIIRRMAGWPPVVIAGALAFEDMDMVAMATAATSRKYRSAVVILMARSDAVSEFVGRWCDDNGHDVIAMRHPAPDVSIDQIMAIKGLAGAVIFGADHEVTALGDALRRAGIPIWTPKRKDNGDQKHA